LRKPDHVVVLGGGIAGLTTGLELLRRGYRITLIERANRVGGLARTFVHDGYRFDIGGHRFHSDDPTLVIWLRDLLGDDLLRVQRHSRIWLSNRFVDYPLQFPNALRVFTPTQMVRILASYAAAMVRTGLDGKGPDRSFEDWVVRRFGRALYDVYFKPYTEKVWGIPCSELSADWAAQRISLPNLSETIRRTLYPGRNPPKTLVSEFWYPRLGFGMIPDRVAAEIERLGGRIITGATVSRVRPLGHRGERGFEIAYQRNHQEQTVRGNWVVSSIPLTVLLDAIPPQLGSQEIASRFRLDYRGIICLYLAVDLPRVSPDSWTYFPQPELLFGRTHEPRNWSPDMVPPGRTSLAVEIFTSHGEPAWELSDDELVDRATREMEAIGFLHRSSVRGAWVVRVRHAYPVYDIGYADRLQRVKEFLSRWPQLHLVGRTGSFRYMNADGVIEDAFALVDYITGQARRRPDVMASYRVV